MFHYIVVKFSENLNKCNFWKSASSPTLQISAWFAASFYMEKSEYIR